MALSGSSGSAHNLPPAGAQVLADVQLQALMRPEAPDDATESTEVPESAGSRHGSVANAGNLVSCLYTRATSQVSSTTQKL